MEDNTTNSVFGLDLGNFFGSIGNKYAESRGYDSVQDLAVGEAAKNISRLTDKPGADTKQTPPVIQPGAWSQAIAEKLPIKLNLSNAQLALGGVLVIGAVILLVRR